MSNVIPSLSLDEWVSDEYGILIKLFEFFITCNKSQSVFYYNEIYSLKKAVSYGYEPEKIINEIKSTLTSLYLTYFERVDVFVTPMNSNSDDSFIYLNVDLVAYTKDNNSYRLTRRIKTSNGDIQVYNEKLETLYSTYRVMENTK